MTEIQRRAVQANGLALPSLTQQSGLLLSLDLRGYAGKS
jgi:hypothetical protein